MIKTREQERMQRTWECLTDRDHLGPDTIEWPKKKGIKKYLTALKKTPSRVHTCGVGQALAFLNSRKEDPPKLAGKHVSRLTLQLLGENGEDLVEKLRQEDSTFFFRATDEVMLVCTWLAFYLEGAGVKPEEDEDDTEGGVAP